jgi:hypothetical protein
VAKKFDQPVLTVETVVLEVRRAGERGATFSDLLAIFYGLFLEGPETDVGVWQRDRLKKAFRTAQRQKYVICRQKRWYYLS